MNSNITFKDVAERAGVSTQTVSRVTNGAANVNPETRKRVQEAIDELGYVPNKGAQLLVQKTAKTFGVLTLDISFQGASRIVEGIRNESAKAGFAISLAVVEKGEEALKLAIRDLKSQQVAAIFINLPVKRELAEKIVLKNKPLPFVFIDVDPEAQVNQVMSDHYNGALQAAELMIKHNRTRFALISGPEKSSASRLRKKAWKDVIEKENATLVTELEGDWSARSGYSKAMEIFSCGQEIDALLVANDQMTLGALRACREQNIDVPQKTAVIGFDDTENSEFFYPPLSTIRQDFINIGHQAVSEVLSCLKNETVEPLKAYIPVKLIERQSTATKNSATDKNDKIESLLSEIKGLLSNTNI